MSEKCKSAVQVTATSLNTTLAFPEAVNYVENADIMVVTGTQLGGNSSTAA